MGRSAAAQAEATKPTRPDWVNYIEDRYGVRMYADVPERWRKWMADEPPHGLGACPSDDELFRAVKWARMQPTGPRDLDVDTLMRVVKWYRKEMAAARRGYRQDSAEGLADAIKQAMLTAPDHAARWDLLCDGLPRDCQTDEERRLVREQHFPEPHRELDRGAKVALKRWAFERWPDFREWLGIELARRHDQFSALVRRLERQVRAEDVEGDAQGA